MLDTARRVVTDAAGGSGGRVAGLAAVVGGAIALGAAAGVAAEKVIVRRSLTPDYASEEPFGLLRGEVVPVLATDGTALHVEVEEPPEGSVADRFGDGLTIVFCHGYALNQDTWHYQRRDLGSMARMVFWDQRDHGRSGRGHKEFATIDQLGADLASVVDATCPPGAPVILVGHSMGGMTVMAYADRRPEEFGERIVGVALISTSAGKLADVAFGLPPSMARAFHAAAPGVVTTLARQKDLVERIRGAGSDLGLYFTRRYSFGSEVSPSLAEFVHRMIWQTPIDVVAEFIPTLDTHDKVLALQAFRNVETLVLVGENDLMTPPQHSDEIAAALTDATLVKVPEAGHMVMLEQYPEVNQQLRELVRRVRTRLHGYS